VTFTYLATVAYSFVWLGGIRLSPIWTAITAIFILERVITVRSRGVAQMAIAAVLLVEMVFDVFLQIVQAKAFWDTAWRKERKW
jgi:hypothetical protein